MQQEGGDANRIKKAPVSNIRKLQQAWQEHMLTSCQLVIKNHFQKERLRRMGHKHPNSITTIGPHGTRASSHSLHHMCIDSFVSNMKATQTSEARGDHEQLLNLVPLLKTAPHASLRTSAFFQHTWGKGFLFITEPGTNPSVPL